MDELAAARALLPWWVRLAPWLYGPALGVVGYLATRLVLRPPAESAGTPWWERARVLFPVRQLGLSVRIVILAVALVVAVGSTRVWVTTNEGRFPWTVVWAWVGPLVAALQFEARLRGLAFKTALRSWASLGIVSFSGVYAIVLFSGLAARDGVAGWVAGLSGVALVAWLGSGGGVMVARRLGLVHAASPKVAGAVERASVRLGIPYRDVLELDWMVANALALPLARRILFTRTAASALEDDELEAVAAHELGHVAEPFALRVFRPAIIISLAAVALIAPRFVRSLEGLGLVFLGLVVVLVVARFAVRWAERHADAHAKDEEGVYARALEKIYALNLVPAVLRRGGAHGHLYDRLVAAGRTPDWPRPPPPPRPPLGSRLLLGLTVVAVSLPMAIGITMRPVTAEEARWALALGSDSGWTVELLARDASTDGRPDDALTLYRAARHLSPHEPFLRGALVVALYNAGHCDEAIAELSQLELDVTTLSLRSDEQEALEFARTAVSSCAP